MNLYRLFRTTVICGPLFVAGCGDETTDVDGNGDDTTGATTDTNGQVTNPFDPTDPDTTGGEDTTDGAGRTTTGATEETGGTTTGETEGSTTGQTGQIGETGDTEGSTTGETGQTEGSTTGETGQTEGSTTGETGQTEGSTTGETGGTTTGETEGSTTGETEGSTTGEDTRGETTGGDACEPFSGFGALGAVSPTFTRPDGTVDTCYLSPFATNVRYRVFDYELTGPGPHDLVASVCNNASFDTFLVVYQAPGGGADPFDPAAGCSNIVGMNDDAPGCGSTSSVSLTGLEPGIVQIVVTSYANVQVGPFTIDISSTTCQ